MVPEIATLWMDFRDILAQMQKPQEPFEMRASDKREMALFDETIERIRTQKLARIREIAWRDGFAALELGDLESQCGAPFVQRETGHDQVQVAYTAAKVVHVEEAYKCVSQHSLGSEDRDTCGWVKGKPGTRFFNGIFSPLCGSSGVTYFCRICGKELAKVDLVVS